MKAKPDDGLVFVGLKVIFVGLILLLFVMMAGDYFYFRHQGARFTVQDGQTLRQRVQRLEAFPKPCQYGSENQ